GSSPSPARCCATARSTTPPAVRPRGSRRRHESLTQPLDNGWGVHSPARSRSAARCARGFDPGHAPGGLGRDGRGFERGRRSGAPVLGWSSRGPGQRRVKAMAGEDDKRAPVSNFIRTLVEEDGRSGKYGGRVATRFPPEPNGYLHIGHAKSICLNFWLAAHYGRRCNDTNPAKEELEYVESIQRDIRWLGFDWADRLFFASDYFEELYHDAEELIRRGLAYVDSLSAEEIRSEEHTYA